MALQCEWLILLFWLVWQGIFRLNAEMCPASPPPQTALVTAASGEKGLWIVWCNSLWLKLTGLNNATVMVVRWQASILSLASGGGIPILVGQNEASHKWRNLYSTIQYNKARPFCDFVHLPSGTFNLTAFSQKKFHSPNLALLKLKKYFSLNFYTKIYSETDNRYMYSM